MATISISATTKQKPCLNYKRHSDIKDRSTNTKIYWCCISYLKDSCYSRLHQCVITNDIIKLAGEHNAELMVHQWKHGSLTKKLFIELDELNNQLNISMFSCNTMIFPSKTY